MDLDLLDLDLLDLDLLDLDLLDLDTFQRGEQDALFRRLREEAPVSWHHHPLGRGFWSVVRHADVVTVNRDAKLFSSEVGSIGLLDPDERDNAVGRDTRGAMMIATDPPRHTRYRRLVNSGFTPRTMKTMEESLSLRATRIVDGIIDEGACDFVTDVAAELPQQAINDLARQRRSDPRDDIVTVLVNAEIEGDGLSEDEFDLFMVLLTLAGNETTRNSTSWDMWALIDHPGQYERLREEPALIDSAVEEILRWASPVLHFRRTATAGTELGGQPIAAGDKVVMWHISANRDEEVFADPFRFDIARTPNNHVAFGGGGPHHCLGAYLARMQLRLMIGEVVARIPDMRLAAAPELLRSNVLRGVKHMPVTFGAGGRSAAP